MCIRDRSASVEPSTGRSSLRVLWAIIVAPPDVRSVPPELVTPRNLLDYEPDVFDVYQTRSTLMDTVRKSGGCAASRRESGGHSVPMYEMQLMRQPESRSRRAARYF